MDKVVLDGKLWKMVYESAIRLTGDESLRKKAVPDEESVPVPSSLEEAREMRFEVDGIRLEQLRKNEDDIILWLCNLPHCVQDDIIDDLYLAGVILDPGKVYKKIADYDRNDGFGCATPTQALPMSDHRLDSCVQYVRINSALLDCYEQFPEE